MNRYILKLKTISNIFIGSAEICSKLEYYQKDKFIYTLNVDSFTKWLLSKNKYDSYFSYIQNMQGAQKSLNNFAQYNQIDLFKDLSIFNHKFYYPSASLNLHDINMFVSTNDKNYIPGSSVKGVIKFALWINKVSKEKDKTSGICGSIKKFISELSKGNESKEDLNKIKKDFEDYNNQIKISISDSNFLSDDDFIIDEKRYVKPNAKNKNPKIPSFYQYLKPNTVVKMRFDIVSGIKIEDITEALNTTYKLYQKNYANKFTSLVSPVASDNVLVLGGGTNFSLKSLYYFFNDMFNDDGETVAQAVSKKLSSKTKIVGINAFRVCPPCLKTSLINDKEIENGICSFEFIKE